MQAHHTITHDSLLRLTRMTLYGLWSEVEFEAFRHDVAQLVASTRHLPPGGVLINLKEFAIQTAGLNDATQDLLSKFGQRLGKTAILASDSTLQKMQIQRVLAGSRLSFFTDEDQAVAWLLQDEAP